MSTIFTSRLDCPPLSTTIRVPSASLQPARRPSPCVHATLISRRPSARRAPSSATPLRPPPLRLRPPPPLQPPLLRHCLHPHCLHLHRPPPLPARPLQQSHPRLYPPCRRPPPPQLPLQPPPSHLRPCRRFSRLSDQPLPLPTRQGWQHLPCPLPHYHRRRLLNRRLKHRAGRNRPLRDRRQCHLPRRTSIQKNLVGFPPPPPLPPSLSSPPHSFAVE